MALALIFEYLAKKAGMEVSQEEYVKRMVERGYTNTAVAQVAANFNRTNKEVSQNFKRGLLIQKFTRLMGAPAMVAPDPEKVVELWQEQNPEFQFQVIALQPEDFEEQARAAIPSDEELTEFYHQLPVQEQRQLFTEEQLKPVVAFVDLDGDFDETKLLERFPLAEGWDEELAVNNYYNQYTTTRFKKPVEDEGEGGEGGEEETPQDPPPTYYTLEEVRDQAAKEARILAGLSAMLVDFNGQLAAKAADPELELEIPDLASEAEALGLTVFAPEEKLTRTQIMENEDWGGTATANQFGFHAAGQFVRTPAVNEGSMTVAYIVEKDSPEEPPFADIRDEVSEKWVVANGKVFAQEKLRALYDEFAPSKEEGEEGETEDPETPLPTPIDQPVVVEDEAFLKAVEDAGLTVIERPYLARGEMEESDPAKQLDLDRFMQFQRQMYEMEAGAVAPPSEGLLSPASYLVRLKDKRDPDPSELRGGKLFQYRSQVTGEFLQEFRGTAFNPASEQFKKTFNLKLKSWEDTPEEEGGA